MAGKEKEHKPDIKAGNCPRHKDTQLVGVVYHADQIIGPSEYRCPRTDCDYRRGRFSGKVLKGKEKEKKPKKQKLPRGGRKPGRTVGPGDDLKPFVKGAGDNEPDWGEI